ncbi:gliding motility lipoprotein GldJ [Galbibacter sp. EGI 63066]|uniref:gliding motility lipoprotein GldJ n=1 Tax=Galbibacter sp. EGI 63066 TaxID=2993559 RepID=UPI002248DCBE|nr:gliding motility lipoprotein GldJ [Galbibacter sp. EGI 63066]MCX2679664.1 gliding motility lipoprotein GldJ [Galbibacter sp. EGI 63066]
MKKYLLNVYVLCLVGFVSFTSCKNSKNTSRATGWQINSKEGGFQYNTDFKEQETAPGLVFLEGGTFTRGKVQDDVMHDWNNTPTKQHVQSFYMDETEVTNKMYMEYLDYLKSVYPPDNPAYANIYKGALPDTLVWRNRLGYNEVMTNNYLRHPAYAEYPVVGVNWVQAVQFSEWRTDRVNELMLEREGYLAKNSKYAAIDGQVDGGFSSETYLNSPSSSYGGQIDSHLGKKAGKDSTTSTYAERSTGVIMPQYRLPTETEWEYAAQAIIETREYNNYRGRKKYPWQGEYTRSGKRRNRGDQLANFKQGKGDYGGIAGWSDDGADITAEVKSYPPNDWGLYDMAGNVAEWVADVYRPIVDDEANDFNYYRGNVYMKTSIGEDGKVKIVGKDFIRYDTLPNGRIVARDLPGEIAMVPVDKNDTYLRTNFSKSDNRNYRDGDPGSTRYYDLFNPEDNENAEKMYNSPEHKTERDSLGNLIKKFDESNTRTTLISDEVRVYKGGSWRDRAYWIDPAQRRYLPQYMATDYIGFRCAMSRVGSKAKEKKTPRH